MSGAFIFFVLDFFVNVLVNTFIASYQLWIMGLCHTIGIAQDEVRFGIFAYFCLSALKIISPIWLSSY